MLSFGRDFYERKFFHDRCLNISKIAVQITQYEIKVDDVVSVPVAVAKSPEPLP